MVQRMQSFDDFDGSPAVDTVRYSYDGRDYEIDLNEEHVREFDEFLAKYIEHSRKVERAQPEPQPRQRRARGGGGERRFAGGAAGDPAVGTGAGDAGE